MLLSETLTPDFKGCLVTGFVP